MMKSKQITAGTGKFDKELFKKIEGEGLIKFRKPILSSEMEEELALELCQPRELLGAVVPTV